MASKYLLFFVTAAVISQGFCFTEITLPEESYTYYTNDLIGKSITIPKSFLDTLLACNVVFPDGVTYEAYPNNNMPAGNVFFMPAVQPFTSCAIGFRGAELSASGRYQLQSLVQHSSDNSLSLTTQTFHITIKEIQPWNAEV